MTSWAKKCAKTSEQTLTEDMILSDYILNPVKVIQKKHQNIWKDYLSSLNENELSDFMNDRIFLLAKSFGMGWDETYLKIN